MTATELKIGFLNLNFSSVPGAKEAIGLRDDIDHVNQTYVDYLNAHGGVAGRKVVAVQRSTDILDESDQNAACTAMVADNKVFAISSTAISAPTAAKCITVDGKTPMVDVLAPSEAVQRAAGGYDISRPPRARGRHSTSPPTTPPTARRSPPSRPPTATRSTA